MGRTDFTSLCFLLLRATFCGVGMPIVQLPAELYFEKLARHWESGSRSHVGP